MIFEVALASVHTRIAASDLNRAVARGSRTLQSFSPEIHCTSSRSYNSSLGSQLNDGYSFDKFHCVTTICSSKGGIALSGALSFYRGSASPPPARRSAARRRAERAPARHAGPHVRSRPDGGRRPEDERTARRADPR